MVLCMLLQATLVAVGVRHYVRLRMVGTTRSEEIVLLTMVLLLMSAGNFIQVGIWAALFMLVGEFSDYTVALYHSGVNFASLGYGDIVMSERWRLLGPLEAANGILMYGLSTAVLTAAVFGVIRRAAAVSGKH